MSTAPTVAESNLAEKPILVALAGQPNVGKSTVFNLLTGLSQHVGNWPGKTVEQKEGTFTYNGTTYRLVDLPGTYSLTASSVEEVIAREFIIRERPDVVVAMVNAATLERSLYLVAELLPLPSPVIVALNMMDVAHSGVSGQRLSWNCPSTTSPTGAPLDFWCGSAACPSCARPAR